MTKTELRQDAGCVAGAALVLVGLWLVWHALPFLVGGAVILAASLPSSKRGAK